MRRSGRDLLWLKKRNCIIGVLGEHGRGISKQDPGLGIFRKPPVVYNFGTGYRLTYTRIYLRCSSLSSLGRAVSCMCRAFAACM
jgi:hypothetical protein